MEGVFYWFILEVVVVVVVYFFEVVVGDVSIGVLGVVCFDDVGGV